MTDDDIKRIAQKYTASADRELTLRGPDVVRFARELLAAPGRLAKTVWIRDKDGVPIDGRKLRTDYLSAYPEPLPIGLPPSAEWRD